MEATEEVVQAVVAVAVEGLDLAMVVVGVVVVVEVVRVEFIAEAAEVVEEEERKLVVVVARVQEVVPTADSKPTTLHL